jgi:hypothetical protein
VRRLHTVPGTIHNVRNGEVASVWNGNFALERVVVLNIRSSVHFNV